MRFFSFICLVSLFFTGIAKAETWNVDDNGSWGVAINWNPASVPNDMAAIATFGNIITGQKIIYRS